MESKISDIYLRKNGYDIKYNNLVFDFITKAYELVDLSKDMYQVERTVKYNKISLKDYILNSDICTILKKNNIKGYYISDLKEYMEDYEKHTNNDISSYKLALDLYVMLEEIEDIEREKVKYLVNELNKVCNIEEINNISKDKYQELYNSLLDKYRGNIKEDNFNKLYNILNDIFNYYLYGGREIPIEIK